MENKFFSEKFKKVFNLDREIKNLKDLEVKRIFQEIIGGKNLKEIAENSEPKVFQEALKKAFEYNLKEKKEIEDFFNYFTKETKEELRNKENLIKRNIDYYIARNSFEVIKNLVSLINDQKSAQSILVKGILKNIKEGNYISHVLKLLEEESLKEIKKHQKIIKRGLLKRLEKGSWVKDYIFLLDEENREKIKKENAGEIENALIIRLQEGGDISDLNELLTSEIVEKIDLNLVRKAITSNLKKINKLEDSYFFGPLKVKSELVLKSLIHELIDNKQKIPNYFLDYISQERIEEIFKENLIYLLNVYEFKENTRFNFFDYEYLLKDKKIIDFLEEVILHFLSKGVDFSIEGFILFEEEDLKKKIEEIKNKKEFQELFKKRIKELVEEKAIYVFPGYFLLTRQEIFKEAFRDGLKEIIKKGEDIDIEYFSRTNEYKNFTYNHFGLVLEVLNSIKEEEQDIVKQAVLKRLKEGKNLYFYLNYLLSEENLKEIKEKREFQDLIKKGFFKRLEKGFSLNDYFDLLNEENKKEIEEKLEDEEKLKEYVKKAILNFFTAELKEKEKGELDIILNDLIKDRSKIFLRKCLLDRTYLPLGLKFYLKEKDEKFKKYFEYRSFKPDANFKSCYVTEVVANPQLFSLCFLVLEKIFQLNQRNFKKNIFFQACFPERLKNEECGILTIAFLLTREKVLKFTQEFFEKNKEDISLTIYDAGMFLNGEHVFFTKDKKPFNPFFEGRTDVLYCSNLKDIENVLTVSTLLMHARYSLKDLLHKDLGLNFIKEFKLILEKYNKLDWLDNKFIQLQKRDVSFDDLEKLRNTLIDITFERQNNEDLREDIRKLIEKYNILINSFNSVEALS